MNCLYMCSGEWTRRRGLHILVQEWNPEPIWLGTSTRGVEGLPWRRSSSVSHRFEFQSWRGTEQLHQSQTELQYEPYHYDQPRSRHHGNIYIRRKLIYTIIKKLTYLLGLVWIVKSQMRFDNPYVGGFEHAGTNFYLRQLHWHHPSEHLINGKRYDMEMHMVHTSFDNKEAAVLGFLYESSSEIDDPFLSEVVIKDD